MSGTEKEYRKGYIPGFRWFPKNQTRPYADKAVVMQNCPLVFCCGGTARATLAVSWFGQMVCA